MISSGSFCSPTNSSKEKVVIAWIFAAYLPFVSAAACEDKKEAKPAKVKVTVVLILASEEGDQVDKSLTAIAEEVKKLNPNLKSFRIKTMMSKSQVPEERVSYVLVEDKAIIVIVKNSADVENRVGVAVKVPNQEEIEYRTVCGKFLPIVTRCQTKANERLIIAIRVQPCQGE
jgi:hypothetical protein